MRSVHWVFFLHAALWVSVWRAAFVHVGSVSRHIMIGGLFAVVKGDFHGLSSVKVDWIFDS